MKDPTMAKCLQRNSSLVSKPQEKDEEISTDVNFIVGDGDNSLIFRAHRAIVAANSSVFEAILYGAQNPNKDIYIPDVEIESFSLMLRCFYGDTTVVGCLEDAMTMTYVAKKFDAPTLLELCIERMVSDTSPENACKVYEFAFKMDLPAVRARCQGLFTFNTQEVMEAESFGSASLATVTDIVSSRYLSVPSESFLLNAVLRWGQEECSRSRRSDLRVVVETLLPHIRFSFMLPEHLLEVNSKYGIPSRKELCIILPVLGMVIPDTILDVLSSIIDRTKETFRCAVMEEVLTDPLQRHFCSVAGHFAGVAGKQFSFGVEVPFGSLFLSVFCIFYKSLSREYSTVDIVVSVSVPNRFTGLKFGRRLPIREGLGVCFVYLPRALYLGTGDTLSVVVRFGDNCDNVQFKVGFSDTCGVTTPVTFHAERSERMLFTLPCLRSF